MRIAGLIALLILFPAFAHAADPPTLTAYTVSHDTIYPSASAESGLATTTAIDIAFSERVKASIKIISVNGAMVKSLYSSPGVTNPEKKIWDGTNTAGTQVDNGTYTILISATSTVTNFAMTDSSKTVIVASSDTTPPAPQTSSSSAPPEYIPIPTLRIITGGDRTVSSGADTAFTAVVYDGRGNKRDDAMITWSFGDGMRRTGASVYHKYYDSGEYAVVARATTSDGGDARSEIIMTVKNAGIKISSVSSRGITLANTDSRTLDISLWRLSMGEQEFKIPEDTQILAGRMTLFPSQIIQLPISNTASLLYPSGEVATTYPVVQPSVPAASYEKVQKVEQIISANTNIQTNDEAVNAPAAANELAAAGAALPPASLPRADSIFRSPGFLGLLGVIALAGSAFIFF
ncbi:MAG: PKD domain-containing protein [Patescibacteria group bacterium]